ncbi:hypothetical protein BOTBODRAFT_50148 [Botryobasidium botryosum FD-172 SS1]|uniref:Uncharacterized protein n=1 Tax=Botryobasidium botryosum (strain FD-172 SS1) TaxID=930990 RepID=A0A067N0Y8_BOTB1|nr:hypothetical protein BOTBODRAFT_50148 [Botryobasidium botryosum FD-172 SS1]
MAPPKARPPTSNALVPRAARHVVPGRSKRRGHDDDDEQDPSTSRAMVLRDGRSAGAGELVLARKIGGYELLKLKADDIRSNAVRAPFRFESLTRIADTQLDAYLAEINLLHDAAFFYDKVCDTLRARSDMLGPSGRNLDPRKVPSIIAPTIRSMIHSTYFLASSWKMIGLLLSDLEDLGLDDETSVKSQLQRNARLRDRFVLLYHTLCRLTDLGRKKLGMAASASDYYSQYFVKAAKGTNSTHQAYMMFNQAQSLGAYKSLIDTIVMELIFPDSEYELHVLYACLRDALEDQPRRGSRFDQRLFDALGDLAVTSQALDLIETPLSGSEGRVWKESNAEKTEEFDIYLEAEYISVEASKDSAPLRDLVSPLERVKSQTVLDELWNQVDESCRRLSGFDIDSLWKLENERDVSSDWAEYRVPTLPPLAGDSSEEEDDDDYPPALGSGGTRRRRVKPGAMVPFKKKSGQESSSAKRKRLAITNGEMGEDSDEMPELLDVSDSDDSELLSRDSDSEDDDDDEWTDDEGYDSDEERALENMLKRALDIDDDMPGLLPDSEDESDDEVPAGKKDKNPFLKLLSNLRGRLFSVDHTLTSETTDRTKRPYSYDPKVKAKATSRRPAKPQRPDEIPPLEPVGARRPLRPQPPVKASPIRGIPPLISAVDTDEERPTAGKAAPTTGHKVTVEDIGDEDESVKTGKKKKKKKKRSKPANPAANGVQTPVSPPASPQPVPRSPPPKSPQAAGRKAPSIASTASATRQSSASHYDPGASLTSLAMPESVAQSSRSYLAQTGALNDTKVKVKSRPEPVPEEKKPSFLDRFRKDKDKGINKSETESGTAKHVFATATENLTKRANKFLHRVFATPEDKTQGKAGMRWEHFVKAMEDMGFTVDPSTAGSSVRFDPPGGGALNSITFHKPHPDSTIHPIMFKEFSKRLREKYNWTNEQFERFEAHN